MAAEFCYRLVFKVSYFKNSQKQKTGSSKKKQ